MWKRELIGRIMNFGYLCGKLEWVGNDNMKDVCQLLDQIITKLADYPEYKEERQAYQEFLNHAAKIHAHAVSQGQKSQPVPSLMANEINVVTADFIERLFKESGELEVVTVEKDPVITRLHDLTWKLKDAEQKVVAEDALRCLEIGAFRAAIVMTWCLTFDYVRRWIFNGKRKRLGPFNANLTARYKNKAESKYHDPIVAYEDFHQHGEAFVLEVAYAAGLYRKQQNQVLSAALTERNHFAHPTAKGHSRASALGYIDTLLTNVLLHPHFAAKPKKKA